MNDLEELVGRAEADFAAAAPPPQPFPSGGGSHKPGTSPTVRAMRAEIERAKAARANPSPQSQGADE